MKRFIISAIAASMLASTSAYADQRPVRDMQQGQYQLAQVNSKDRIVKKRMVIKKNHDVRKKVVKKTVVKKQRWGKGQRYANWKRHRAVHDYGRHGLRRPGRGQQWIRVDNDYLLIAIGSGVIASIIASR